MIDEKKIEEAAEKYAIDTYAFDEPVPTEYKEGIQEVFQTSINWFKENLWHDASEEPIQVNKDSEFVKCLVQLKDGELNMLSYDTWHHWWVCNIDNEAFLNIASRWLYIDDLMKGGK